MAGLIGCSIDCRWEKPTGARQAQRQNDGRYAVLDKPFWICRAGGKNPMKDKKTLLIWALLVVVILLAGFIFYQRISFSLQQKVQQAYSQGIRDGQLLEQRNVINGILASGAYTIPIIDQENRTQTISLGIVSAPQTQAAQKAAVSQTAKKST
ncbi:hypothetical protein HYU13_00145 [Candidatus Woesearchaeota archaeon]|nr:hypothetical protein [Candidatus Woesearchaeota archaeon]